jgi:hypothetical protein
LIDIWKRRNLIDDWKRWIIWSRHFIDVLVVVSWMNAFCQQIFFFLHFLISYLNYYYSYFLNLRSFENLEIKNHMFELSYYENRKLSFLNFNRDSKKTFKMNCNIFADNNCKKTLILLLIFNNFQMLRHFKIFNNAQITLNFKFLNNTQLAICVQNCWNLHFNFKSVVYCFL